MKKELLPTAIEIAYNAHDGQFRRSGDIYFTHCEGVANLCETESQKIVAYLHDVLEKTEYPFYKLREIFPGYICEAIFLLTHMKSVPYEAYIDNLKTNKLARAVKLADIAHNSIDATAKARNKYKRALKILNG